MNRHRIEDFGRWHRSPDIWRTVLMQLHCRYRVALLESMGSWNTVVSLSGKDAFGKMVTVRCVGTVRGGQASAIPPAS